MDPDRIPLARPCVGEPELNAVRQVLESGWLVQGARVAELEARLARRLGVAHCVACSSGTAALHLAALALDLPRGDEVLVPAYTFPATAAALMHAGLSPVLVDVDPATFAADPERLSAAIGPRTRALLAVHPFGHPIPATLLDVCADARIALLEDAACALGAALEHGGLWRAVGSLGRLSCFSLHPRKIITTGEGGWVATDEPELARRLRLLRSHGMVSGPDGYAFELAGLNYRMSDIQGALGLAQLDRLDALLADRRRIAGLYELALAGLPLALPRETAGMRATWQSYVVRLPDAVRVTDVVGPMRALGIEVAPGAHALHLHPPFQGLRRAPDGLHGAERAAATGLALPVPWGLTGHEVERVAQGLAGVLASAT